MTDQEVYDNVKAHLLQQGKRSETMSTCRYRSDDGLKCAIGCLIPDDRYSRDLEGWRADRLCVLDAAGLERGQAELARALQYVHDGTEPEKWERQLGNVAVSFGLTP